MCTILRGKAAIKTFRRAVKLGIFIMPNVQNIIDTHLRPDPMYALAVPTLTPEKDAEEKM